MSDSLNHEGHEDREEHEGVWAFSEGFFAAFAFFATFALRSPSWHRWSAREGSGEELRPVSPRKSIDIGIGPAADAERVGQLREIGRPVEAARQVVGGDPSVQVGAKPYAAPMPHDLGDVFGVTASVAGKPEVDVATPPEFKGGFEGRRRIMAHPFLRARGWAWS